MSKTCKYVYPHGLKYAHGMCRRPEEEHCAMKVGNQNGDVCPLAHHPFEPKPTRPRTAPIRPRRKT